ncbi:MAG: deoxyribonuclease HsdR, partial [Bacteroidales bacterium]|nr:deoxyribonuclease HsdR [Bacteroidales bacterium]
KVGDVAVNSGTAVQEQISRLSPGEKVTLVLLRGDKEVTVTATLQNQSGNTEIVKESGDISNFLGAQLRPVGKELKDKLKIRMGIEVMSVGEGKMKDAGIRKGFIITHVNQKPVSSVQELAASVHGNQRGALIEGKYPDGSVYYYALGN